MKLKLFASIPMRGKTSDEIRKLLLEAKEKAEMMCGTEVELLDTIIEESPPEGVKHPEVWYLGKSIQLLAEADIVYFSSEWENYRGCVIEHLISEKYKILYMDTKTVVCSLR